MNSRDDGAGLKPALQYAEEILCANWNPLALQLGERMVRAQSPGLEAADADALLARVYRCQQA